MFNFHLGGRHDFSGFAGNERNFGTLALGDRGHIVRHMTQDDIFRPVFFMFAIDMSEATGNRSNVH